MSERERRGAPDIRRAEPPREILKSVREILARLRELEKKGGDPSVTGRRALFTFQFDESGKPCLSRVVSVLPADREEAKQIRYDLNIALRAPENATTGTERKSPRQQSAQESHTRTPDIISAPAAPDADAEEKGRLRAEAEALFARVRPIIAALKNSPERVFGKRCPVWLKGVSKDDILKSIDQRIGLEASEPLVDIQTRVAKLRERTVELEAIAEKQRRGKEEHAQRSREVHERKRKILETKFEALLLTAKAVADRLPDHPADLLGARTPDFLKNDNGACRPKVEILQRLNDRVGFEATVSNDDFEAALTTFDGRWSALSQDIDDAMETPRGELFGLAAAARRIAEQLSDDATYRLDVHPESDVLVSASPVLTKAELLAQIDVAANEGVRQTLENPSVLPYKIEQWEEFVERLPDAVTLDALVVRAQHILARIPKDFVFRVGAPKEATLLSLARTSDDVTGWTKEEIVRSLRDEPIRIASLTDPAERRAAIEEFRSRIDELERVAPPEPAAPSRASDASAVAPDFSVPPLPGERTPSAVHDTRWAKMKKGVRTALRFVREHPKEVVINPLLSVGGLRSFDMVRELLAERRHRAEAVADLLALSDADITPERVRGIVDEVRNKINGGAEVSPDVAEELRAAITDFHMHRGSLKEVKASLRSVLDTHFASKVKKLEFAREALNTGLMFGGGAFLRPAIYAGFHLAERWARIRKEKKEQGEQGGLSVREMTYGAFTETWEEMWGHGKAAAQDGGTNRLVQAKAWGNVLRYVGIGAYASATHWDQLLDHLRLAKGAAGGLVDAAQVDAHLPAAAVAADAVPMRAPEIVEAPAPIVEPEPPVPEPAPVVPKPVEPPAAPEQAKIPARVWTQEGKREFNVLPPGGDRAARGEVRFEVENPDAVRAFEKKHNIQFNSYRAWYRLGKEDGLRWDEKDGPWSIADDHNNDGKIDTETVRRSIVRKDFGDGPEDALCIETIDHPDADGSRAVGRMFVRADGQFHGDIDGDVRLADRKDSVSVAHFAAHGTASKVSVDLDRDGIVDDASILDLRLLPDGREVPRTIEVDGVPHALTPVGGPLADGSTRYEYTDTSGRVLGTMTLEREADGRFTASAAPLAYDEVNTARMARGESLIVATVPAERTMAMTEALAAMEKNPVTVFAGTVSVWDATEHRAHIIEPMDDSDFSESSENTITVSVKGVELTTGTVKLIGGEVTIGDVPATAITAKIEAVRALPDDARAACIAGGKFDAAQLDFALAHKADALGAAAALSRIFTETAAFEEMTGRDASYDQFVALRRELELTPVIEVGRTEAIVGFSVNKDLAFLPDDHRLLLRSDGLHLSRGGDTAYPLTKAPILRAVDWGARDLGYDVRFSAAQLTQRLSRETALMTELDSAGVFQSFAANTWEKILDLPWSDFEDEKTFCTALGIGDRDPAKLVYTEQLYRQLHATVGPAAVPEQSVRVNLDHVLSRQFK